jgi:translation initiation factor 1
MNTRSVYETGKGRICPHCGWPSDDCHCASHRDEPVPDEPSAILRLEKKGRGGKSVTVVAGLPRNAVFLRGLAAALKRSCGTGGTASDGQVEIQGDQRERLRVVLQSRGMRVKG